MSVRRSLVVGAVTVFFFAFGARPAAANVGLSVSLAVPSLVTLGQTVSGSFTVTNLNTVPYQGESQTVNSLRLAPSCGSLGAVADLCPTPDLGVFAVGTPAAGHAGTACAGIAFSVSPNDPSGIITFTSSSTVVLAPPGGAPGTDRCTVDFSLQALKAPNLDASPNPGVQTWVNFSSRTTSLPSNLSPAQASSVQLTVNRATPAMATAASPSVAIGGVITDTATLSSVSGVAVPTGTVFFQVYGPNDATCTGPAAFQSTNAVSPASGFLEHRNLQRLPSEPGGHVPVHGHLQR